MDTDTQSDEQSGRLKDGHEEDENPQDRSSVATTDVDQWSLEKTINWLDRQKIDYNECETLDEMKALVSKSLSKSSTDSALPPDKDSQSILRYVLTQQRQMKAEIERLYYDVRKVTTDCDKIVRAVLTVRFGDYEKQIQCNIDDMNRKECPILVIGETSSGKSSLINLLIGTPILPTALLAESKAICCIHNSKTLYFTVEYTNDKIITENVDTAEKMPNALASFIGRKTAIEKHNIGLKKVDVYFPMDFLPDYATIVDSPGVGEDDELTQQVLKYLPQAAAFIYVIDSSNAGGVQPDKLGYIVEEQKRLEMQDELVSNDFGDVIVVCNKWDIVEDQGQNDDVWKKTVESLKALLPNLREDHIFKMSTKRALRHVQLDLENTEHYRNFLMGLHSFLPLSAIAKLNRHYRWQGRFIETVRVCIATQIQFAKSSKEEKQHLENRVKSKLEALKTLSSKIQNEVDETFRDKNELVVKNLHSYIKRVEVKEIFFDCKYEESFSFQLFGDDYLRLTITEILQSKMRSIVMKWETETQMQSTLSSDLRKFLTAKMAAIEVNCQALDACFEGDSDIVISSDLSPVLLPGTRDIFWLKRQIKATGIIFLGSALAAIPVVGFPFGVAVLAYGCYNSIKGAVNYMIPELGFREILLDASKQLYKHISDIKNLNQIVNESYFEPFKAKCRKFIKINIDNEIASKELLLNMTLDNIDATNDQVISMQTFQKQIENILNLLKLFELLYIATDSYSDEHILRKDLIGSGSFSNVYRGIKHGKEPFELAVKVFKERIKQSGIVKVMREINILRKVQNERFVEYIGFSFKQEILDSSVAKLFQDGFTFSILFEKCDTSLEAKIFENENLQCWRFQTKEAGPGAFQLFTESACSICEGLEYLHKEGIIHRDLKLSNVLVKGDAIKICDLGSATTLDRIGSHVGTITHMSPEILRRGEYGTSTDIYSFGILLWEMWYGRHSYSDGVYGKMDTWKLIEEIRNGLRPSLDYQHQMSENLRSLVKKCWDQEPSLRPTAATAKEEIKHITLLF